MTVVELLQELRRLGVHISAQDDRLVVDAPAGVITPALAGEIRSSKPELLELLRSAGTAQADDVSTLDSAPDENRLSLTQKRIWAISQLDPENSQFNLPGGWWLDGTLDVDLLSRAIDAFEARHDIFRRRFISDAGKPRVSPPDQPGVDFRIMSLGDIGLDSEDGAGLTHWFETIAAEPFDLSSDALLRVVLLRVHGERHLLSVISHSIVWDAWSYDIFLSEVGRHYEALLTGESLAERGHQYADFVRWQRAHQERPAARQALEQAIVGLAGFERRLALPHVHRAPDLKDHSGARFNFDIPADLREDIRTFTRQQGVTPFMVFLAAYSFLLCRYAGKDRALVTIPLRGRERPEFESIAGPFTNNLFLPVDVSGHTFASLLAHVKQETGRTFGGEVPGFERLIEAIDQNLADSAFFQLQFSYQNVENRGTEWASGIRISAGPTHDADSAHAEISFWMREGADNMDGAIDYRTALFDEPFIASFFQRLLGLIRGAMAAPDSPLSELACDAPTQRESVTGKAAPPPVDTLQRLESALEAGRDRPAILTPSGRNSSEQLQAWLDPAGEARQSASGADDDGLGELRQALAALVAGQDLPGGPGDPPAAATLNAAVAAWGERLTDSRDSVLVALPDHPASRIAACLGVLGNGGQLCLPARAEAADESSLRALIRRWAPTLVVLPSPLMEALLDLDDPPKQPAYLVLVLPGASKLQERISQKGLLARYLVATEETLGIGLTGAGNDWPLTFDRCEPGITARVVDAMDRDQWTGLDGRLRLSLANAPAVAERPGMTVRRDARGCVCWPDTDPVDNSGIEAMAEALRTLDAVQDAHVERRRTNPATRAMIAWVAQAPRREVGNTQLRDALRERGTLPPSVIINVDRIPRDRHGAVVRRALVDPDLVPLQARFEPPATAGEIGFAGIWKDVLSVDRISVNDTFANLGGNSVQALVILSETQKRMDCSFEPRRLFFQSLRQIAADFPMDEPAQATAP